MPSLNGDAGASRLKIRSRACIRNVLMLRNSALARSRPRRWNFALNGWREIWSSRASMSLMASWPIAAYQLAPHEGPSRCCEGALGDNPGAAREAFASCGVAKGTFAANDGRGYAHARTQCWLLMVVRMWWAVWLGVVPTVTPAASRAVFLAVAVPVVPEMMAPAWPMVLPSGAVKPAT